MLVKITSNNKNNIFEQRTRSSYLVITSEFWKQG